MNRNCFTRFLSVCVILPTVVSIATADDNSSYVDVDTSLYAARDITVSGAQGGFSAADGVLHYWNPTDGYCMTDTADGTTTVIGLPDGGVNSNGYGDAFGCYDPVTQTFYAATIAMMSDAHIYSYDASLGQWTGSASAVNAYGADTYNGRLYFSGLTEPWNGSTGQDNYISRYVADSPYTDGSGFQLHDTLIQTVGNSASVAVDQYGNVYYASYNFSGSALYRWDAEQVSTAINDIVNGELDTYLTLSDATILTQLDGGGNGIAVDDAGNVFMTINGGSEGALVVMWNEAMGTGEDYFYDVIAMMDASQYWGWFGELDIDGNFLAGDPLYGCFGWENPITEITCMVPEPATLLLLGLGMTGLLRGRRK